MHCSDKILCLFSALLEDGIAAECGYPLSRLTTMRVGGDAAIAIFPKNAREAADAVRRCRENGVEMIFFGAGSNLLAPDDGYSGAVMVTTAMDDGFSVTEYEDGRFDVTVSAGCSLTVLARMLMEAELSGGEFLFGIPGTVGGAVAMNAGAYGGEIKDILVSSTYLELDGDLTSETRDAAAHDFSYRHSIYLSRPNEMITQVYLRLRRGDREEIHRTMLSLMEQRRAKQPLEYPSAGSFFKRPVGAFAGKLIEDCGLKGYTVGGAQISEKHAGFVINRGGATEADIRRLSKEVRRIVYEKTGYLLECEIRPMTGDPI